jgi:hypothetical protein
MAEINVADPRWEDPVLLRADMLRSGLITRSKDGHRLRTYGWLSLVALSVIAEGEDVSGYPGLGRALFRAKEVLDADTD